MEVTYPLPTYSTNMVLSKATKEWLAYKGVPSNIKNEVLPMIIQQIIITALHSLCVNFETANTLTKLTIHPAKVYLENSTWDMIYDQTDDYFEDIEVPIRKNTITKETVSNDVAGLILEYATKLTIQVLVNFIATMRPLITGRVIDYISISSVENTEDINNIIAVISIDFSTDGDPMGTKEPASWDSIDNAIATMEI